MQRLFTDFPLLIGLDIDGLYRVSGNLAVIQKLRFNINHGKPPSYFDGVFHTPTVCIYRHLCSR